MDSINEVLDAVKVYCKEKTSDATYAFYIKDIRAVSFENSNTITLELRSEFVMKIVSDRYTALLKEAFKAILGFDVEILYVAAPPEDGEKSDGSEPKMDEKSLPSGRYDFTFENFIKGPSNQFAFAAAQAVAANPSGADHPLSINGPAGLGPRFVGGLSADIQPPVFETRVAIVKRKAELLNLDLPNDVAEYIANHLKQNIRQLEGAVKKLNAYYMLEGIEPCIGVTTTAIKDTLNDSQPIPVTIEKILNEVARTYNVMPADIRGKKRNANVSAARQMTMYIIREVTGMSMEAIGQEFQRDHSTVVYSIKTMEENINRDQHLKEMCSDIMKNVRA